MSGTPTDVRSASLITRESISCDVVPLALVSNVTFATAATASLRLNAWILCIISNGNSASLRQYSTTSSGRFAHSSSILEASISIFCISSLSGNNSLETNFRVSLCGLNAWRACHHASITHRPATFQARAAPLVGINVSLRLPSSVCVTLPHPITCALSGLFDLAIRFALSTILPISKLSILYPVIMSGSLSLTNLVICRRIVSSSSAKV